MDFQGAYEAKGKQGSHGKPRKQKGGQLFAVVSFRGGTLVLLAFLLPSGASLVLLASLLNCLLPGLSGLLPGACKRL